MARDINKDEFPEETKLKLEIFAECFREWLPVFLHNIHIQKIFIYDFFAGSGMDIEGNFGSPLILLNEAKGENCKYCNLLRSNGKQVCFGFNEKLKQKHDNLVRNVNSFINRCKSENCKLEKCIYSYDNFAQLEFKEIISQKRFNEVLNNRDYGKFILLDQYGFSQVDEDIFLRLVNAPKTDFIFFISSSFIKRFKEHPAIKQYFDTQNIPFDEAKPQECHRLIADYYQNLIPTSREYYLHHFTIKKGSNYWGLIFGSNHTLGMEKFLKVCWEKDKFSGESNCNIDNDYQKGTLFYTEEETNKKQMYRSILRDKILSGEIKDNITGLKYALKNRCLPELFTQVMKELENEKLISRTGKKNYSSTNIHKIQPYLINLLNYENN
ncbi:MAG: three-Cys-motif partner protein TcmP [Bacteroidales bacterium]|jgi:three-Cys-motif partner protein|nr:three-Cys-motif partner protein TcmP [Bacteroidales bacterium]